MTVLATREPRRHKTYETAVYLPIEFSLQTDKTHMPRTRYPKGLRLSTISLERPKWLIVSTTASVVNFLFLTRIAEVIFLLIPDQAQPRVFNEQIAPSLKDNAVIVIASGYNVHFKLLNFKSSQDVVMVAPR